MADTSKALLALFEGLVTARAFTPDVAKTTLEHIMPHLPPKLAEQAWRQLQRQLASELGGVEILDPHDAPRGGLPGMPGSDSR